METLVSRPVLPATPNLTEGAYAEIGGIKTHYHLSGEGPVIVFIHGSGPGVSAWANWRLAMPVLKEHFTVAGLDVVGFGYSNRPDGFDYSTQAWTDHTIKFIEALGVGPVHLVGNSMGGGVALRIASQRPELVNKMVLMGTTGCAFEITPGLAKVWGYRPSPANMYDILKLFLYDQSQATSDLAELRYKASIQPGFQESWEAMFYEKAQPGKAPLQWRVDDLALEDSQIAAINKPALIIHGREDQIIPVNNALHVFNLIQDAQLHIFGKCGHWSQIEHAGEFNQLLTNFFQN
jgi:pimeloyl-ACP methyl ester carboxylesterase